jgi:preprotein translocase subunit Sec61beta
MAKDNTIQTPGVFGGLMRYNEEYKSTLMFKPWHVLAFIVALAVVVIGLKIFFPITSTPTIGTGNIPIPSHSVVLSLIK